MKIPIWQVAGLSLVAILTACVPASASDTRSATAPDPRPTASQSPAASDSPTPAPEASQAIPTTPPRSPADADLLAAETPPPGAEREFSTDFNKHIVSYKEILSGGPPKDGIPAIDEPKFVTVTEADTWLEPQEPVILFRIGDDARAYPLRILTWHEIVNDVVDGEPVVVTFCPLCNTAIAFESTLDDRILDFGTTGRLRFSNLVMYDRQTETWWQQATGEAIAGEHTGRQLTFLPAAIISWENFRSNHADGRVLSMETGFVRDYGRNPYAGYDNINSSPFLYRGPDISGRLAAMARVLTVDLNGEAAAYTYELLQQARVINDRVGGEPVVIFWQPGTASALDSPSLADGRDVGSGTSFSSIVDGETLTFIFDGEQILDENTGSVWNLLGRAVEGPLANRSLKPVVSVNHFWFSWAAFKPDTRVYQVPQ